VVSLCGCCKWRGISSLCCSRVFSACWIGEVSSQYLILIKCISRSFGSMSLNFIARQGGEGFGLAPPSAGLSRAPLLALIGRPS